MSKSIKRDFSDTRDIRCEYCGRVHAGSFVCEEIAAYNRKQFAVKKEKGEGNERYHTYYVTG